MRYLFLLLLVGCGLSQREGLRIGVDPTWYMANFGPQSSYVNGYLEDVFLEIAHYSGMQFELIRANSDNLLGGMSNGKYEVVATTLPPYEFHKAKYAFSENVLSTGPVLVIPSKSEKNSLENLEGDLVGIIDNDPSELILAKYPSIIVRKYSSIPALLDAVMLGNIQGALLDNIPAVNYVSDIYAGILQIVGKPLTPAGIHLIGPKGSIDAINKNLKALQKKKTLKKLQKKWQLIY